ncbi:hypothetical protein JZ751_025043 [Albula glossodonta]|uniref:Calponin-homology (CH) domain-containing protein n=1 Tax=Albula glossodonta TaxID=121402 RepID=A0A8T2PCS1_9TELE|nr:hypothetical protein JZ751_025043 [Albula glossodonta]
MNNLRKGDFLDFSPTKSPMKNCSRVDRNKENDKSLAVLSLVQFSRSPFVSFGTVKLGSSRSSVLRIENPIDDITDIKVDRVASSKGFSVDQTRFIIQPDDSTCLTINWTPVEEGNVRELITFISNGIAKHQAILLGRAEAPKKKKKSLWDSIKTKNTAGICAALKEKKSDSSLQKAANKTFHVSRQPQYTKERVRKPLRSCNEETAIQEQAPILSSSIENQCEHFVQERSCTPVPLQTTKVKSVQTLSESVVSQKNSPVVVLVPAAKLFDVEVVAGSPCAVDKVCIPDHKNVTRVLNTTHLSICTPERGVNPLIPHIHSSQIPISSDANVVSCANKTFLPGTPVLSVKDALAIIQSDLEVDGASPPNACSSFDFSDSLESVQGNRGADQSSLGHDATEKNILEEMSPQLEPVRPRLTFFVNSNKVNCGDEAKVTQKCSKIPFSSTTVTKSKPHSTQESNPANRKTRTSRRRLLEQTLELSEDKSTKSSLLSQNDVSGLPVIDSDANFGAHECVHTLLVALPSDLSPVRVAHSSHVPDSILGLAQVDLSAVEATPSLGSQTYIKTDPSELTVQHQLTGAPVRHPDRSPVQRSGPVPAQPHPSSKKRKSDEFLIERTDKEKAFPVKRSRLFPTTKEPKKPMQERKFSSRSTSQKLQKKAVVPGSSNSVCIASKAAKSASVTVCKASFSKSGPQKSFGSSSVKTAKVVAVAQSQLTFIKPAQTVIPRHPLPFAAKNMFYDERWIEKQERGFTWWINYVLTPDEFKVCTEVTKVNALSLAMGSEEKFGCPKAPTKEEMSFKMYTARRRLNSLRRAACQLFTSEAMVKAIQRLELEVEAKRLLVRKDRHLWKDVGERQKVLTWLLSYNPLWLRIGLETIFGELIPLESNSDTMGLAVFILNRLLWNPDIAAEFRHAKVPHLYRDGHEEALSRFTLKKLLLLVCFLDKAKESRMIEHDPCLFCMDAEFKTSKDLLLAFSRDFLRGEGILSRHLGHLGLVVSHAQTPLDEFNFAVKNLAVDLKCGIRLVRVMELFTQDWSLSRKLRMPAISRLQKVHNVEVALEVLKAKGVDLKDEHGGAIDSRDIVDGHREKTLTLLWKIIFAFQVEVLLDEEQLKEEICFLKQTWRTRQKLNALRHNQDVAQKPKDKGPSFKHSSAKITLLMDWVNAVSVFYNTKAENFTVAFSDGQVLCYLIHHYHPCHLPMEAVCQNTTQTVECGQRGMVGLNCSSSDSDSSFDMCPGLKTGTDASMDFKELLENERSNFQLVNTAVSYLGGVPAMINPSDMSNTIPNEKVVVCYLSFLCARLLDLRKETRAARIIQGAWRKHRLNVEMQHYKEINAAAATIQSAVRRFLQRRRTRRQNAAAIVIQTIWRGYSARKEIQKMQMEKLHTLQASAAIIIQAHWRRHLAVRKFQRIKYYTVMVQARLRMKMAVTAYRRILWAARTIQKYRIAWQLAKIEREKYLSLRYSVVKIQESYRKWKTRTWIKKTRAATVIQRAFKKWQERKLAGRNVAAVKIQSWYKMQKCQKQYRNFRQKAIAIQAWYRGSKERRNLQFVKLQHYSATAIQRAFKTNILRRRFIAMKEASIVIQRWFRACKEKEKQKHQYLKMKHAAVTLQATFRGYLVRKEKKEQHQAAVVIQTAFRKFVAQKGFLSLRTAAVTIQQQYRALIQGRKIRKDYMTLRQSVVMLQAFWRGRAERKRIEGMHKAAVLIQSQYRRYAVQAKFKLKRNAALSIQSYYRAYASGRTVRLHYLQVKKAAVSLQAGFRGMKARQELRGHHRAATLIQAAFKSYTCRRQFLSLRSAATILQRHYRACLLTQSEQRHYSQLRQVTIKIQAVYRGSKERRNLKRMHQAATLIQAHFRRHKAQVTYTAARCAASIIQQRYRAFVKGRCVRENYLQIRDSVVVLQSAYRGMKARLQIQKMHRAATLIQAHYLKHVQVVKFQRLCWAASVVRKRFRANQERNIEVQKYTALKKAAICIQSSFRGMRTRKRVTVMQEAARIIQRRYRAHRERKRYLALKVATVRIQQWYKAFAIGRIQRKRYLSLLTAAITVQSVYRGMKVRREIQGEHKAATVIQAAFLMYRTRMAFKAMRLAATILQRRYRAYQKAKREREHFLNLRHSAIVIQSIFRGKNARNEIRRQHCAATVIQSQFRMYQCCMHFQKMRRAAIAVQERYRACRVRDAQVKQYKLTRSAVVVIQRAFRGYRARQQVSKMHKAATVIQRRFCTFRERKRFLSLRASAAVVQQRYRALVVMRRQQKEYLSRYKAIVALQAAYRGMRVRQHLQVEHKAAIIIQAHVRMYFAKSFYNRLQWAVKVIQLRFKANKLMKKEIQTLKEKKVAAVMLQAAFRGMKTRRHVKQMHEAASDIQRSFRTYRARKQYLCLKSSAIAIQRRYRSVTAVRRQKELYDRLCCATVTLQAAYRGHATRREIRQKHAAATVIQTAFRRHREIVKFQAMKLSAIIIQRHYKSYSQSKKDREKFLRLRNSVVTVQAAFRGQRARRNIAQMHKAATVIQSSFRMHRQQAAFKSLHWAATVLQQRFRACRMRVSQELHYQQIRKAAICIQASFRGNKARELVKRMISARKIQSYLRMCVKRRCFLQQKAAAIVIQSAFRGHLARNQYKKMQASSIRIQRWYRSRRLASKQMAEYLAVRKATVTLQSAFRAMLARRLAKQKCAAVKVQSVLQMVRHRKKFLDVRSSTFKLQAYYRMWVARRRFMTYRAAAQTLQRHFRAQQLMKEQRCVYLHTLKSVQMLQAAVRGYIDHKKFQKLKRSAVAIQASYRGMVERRTFLQKKVSAAKIQAYYRAHVLCTNERVKYLKMKQTIILIQAAFRGHQARRHAKKLQASLKIQAWFRGNMARQKFIAKKKAIATVHRCLQTKLLRKRFQKIRHSACILQRRWRETVAARKVRHNFMKTRTSTVKIQALWRGHSVRVSLQKEHKAACLIQSSYWGQKQRQAFLQQRKAVLVLQRHFRALQRGRQGRETFKNMKTAVITLQAFCRGWLVRRQRWVKAKLQKKRYLEKKERVIKLQRAVRWWLNRRNAAATVIQHAVKKYLTKRREQRMQHGIIKLQAMWRGHQSRKITDTSKVVAMRHRFKKYNKTTEAVYAVENSIDTLLDLLQIYREKAGDKVTVQNRKANSLMKVPG